MFVWNVNLMSTAECFIFVVHREKEAKERVKCQEFLNEHGTTD